MSESETRRPAAGPSEERSELARVKRERDAAQVVFQQEAALREATQKLLTLARRERDEARRVLRSALEKGLRPQCVRCGEPLMLRCRAAERVPCRPAYGEGASWLEAVAALGPLPESVVTQPSEPQEQPK